jgi:hypothetical protein
MTQATHARDYDPVTPSAQRFRHPLQRIYSFMGEVLVECPHCSERAVARPTPDWPTSDRPAFVPRRLVCPSCGFVDETSRPLGFESVPSGIPTSVPLWLTTECRGKTLWAYNVDHLDLLKGYVGAPLRERGTIPGSMSLVERLPAWIKLSKNRGDVLRAIARLRQRTA